MTVDMDYFSLYESYQQKYNHLKQKFVEISSPHVNATNIQTLKDFYDSVINSKRASDDIKDLYGLIKILEKRSVLSYNQIEPLKYVATSFVQDPVLNNVIKEYELQLENQRQLPPFNIYKCKSGEYFNRENEENFSELSEINPLQEIVYDSEQSHLLNSQSINHHPQSSTDELLNNKTNNQNNNTTHLSYSNLNLYNLNNNNTVYNISNNYNNNNFTNNGYKNFRSKCLIVITLTTMVLLIVTIALVFITNYLKYSVLAVTPIPPVSTTDAIGSSGSSGSNLSQLNLERISLVNPTTNQLTYPPHQQAPTVQQNSVRLSELQSKVFRYLSENLGRSWRDLARFLGVKEAEIDFIDSKSFYETKDKAVEALNIFQEKCDPCNWQKILIKSLETVRRKDLAENVTDMILAENK